MDVGAYSGIPFPSAVVVARHGGTIELAPRFQLQLGLGGSRSGLRANMLVDRAGLRFTGAALREYLGKT